MTEYTPYYINGRRDTSRRYISPSGNIISYRQYIKLSSSLSPEQKAVKRYKEGKAPAGKTVNRYLQREERKAERERKQKERKPKPAKTREKKPKPVKPQEPKREKPKKEKPKREKPKKEKPKREKKPAKSQEPKREKPKEPKREPGGAEPLKGRRPLEEVKEVRLQPGTRERGFYQLVGVYRFYNSKYHDFKTEIGYSNATWKTKTGMDLQVLRNQAVEVAKAKLDGYNWVLVSIIEEYWIKW